MESKHYDTFIGLLYLRCDLDWNIPNKPLHLALRDIHELLKCEQSIQLSVKARDKYKIPKIERGVGVPKDNTIEHIIPVRHIVKKILKMYLWRGWKDREKIEEFIEKTFYAVYKLKSERQEEYDAEELIMEQFRTEKIKYFNEYTTKR